MSDANREKLQLLINFNLICPNIFYKKIQENKERWKFKSNCYFASETNNLVTAPPERDLTQEVDWAATSQGFRKADACSVSGTP